MSKHEVEIERFDDGVCCECGQPTHTCADCPTFGGPGFTPGFPDVSGLRFIDVADARFIEQDDTRFNERANTMTNDTKDDLFESGWADFHGDDVDRPLWDGSNHYRGGWLAAWTRAT